jgi:hypothetical protein
MEPIIFNADKYSILLSFDGRVLEIVRRADASDRYHISQISSVELRPPDKHGEQMLRYQMKVFGSTWYNLAPVAPEQVGAAQQFVAAVQQAILAPR